MGIGTGDHLTPRNAHASPPPGNFHVSADQARAQVSRLERHSALPSARDSHLVPSHLCRCFWPGYPAWRRCLQTPRGRKSAELPPSRWHPSGCPRHALVAGSTDHVDVVGERRTAASPCHPPSDLAVTAALVLRHCFSMRASCKHLARDGGGYCCCPGPFHACTAGPRFGVDLAGVAGGLGRAAFS